MKDLTLTRDDELAVVQVEGNTDQGTEFVDEYNPAGVEYQVVDSGRIVLPPGAAEALKVLALERDLTWEEASSR